MSYPQILFHAGVTSEIVVYGMVLAAVIITGAKRGAAFHEIILPYYESQRKRAEGDA